MPSKKYKRCYAKAMLEAVWESRWTPLTALAVFGYTPAEGARIRTDAKKAQRMGG